MANKWWRISLVTNTEGQRLLQDHSYTAKLIYDFLLLQEQLVLVKFSFKCAILCSFHLVSFKLLTVIKSLYDICGPPTPKGIDVCKTLRGFMIMMTRQGKMLHVSENASEYLGHSVVSDFPNYFNMLQKFFDKTVLLKSELIVHRITYHNPRNNMNCNF